MKSFSYLTKLEEYIGIKFRGKAKLIFLKEFIDFKLF